jgi:preprotein translocase subunit YajC
VVVGVGGTVVVEVGGLAVVMVEVGNTTVVVEAGVTVVVELLSSQLHSSLGVHPTANMRIELANITLSMTQVCPSFPGPHSQQ